MQPVRAPASVLVIGGGPAGSLAALLLARGGATVTLIEQSRFPRDKVCGECLAAIGLDVLDRHGLGGRVRAAGVRLLRTHLFSRHHSTTNDLPRPMLGLSRAKLDDLLLQAARDGGVSIRQPARVERVESDDNGVVVRSRCLVSNQVTDEAGDWAVLADGRGNFSSVRPPPTDDLGIKAHFIGVRADPAAITLYGGMGCYGGVAPIEDDRWNAAFAVPRTIINAARGNVAAAWKKIVADSPALTRHFADARPIAPWLAAPLPRHGVSDDWSTRTVPVGAATCAIEPVGGEGMGTSLRSAELAADAILTGTTAALPAAYRNLWRRRSLFCRLGGMALSDPRWSDGVGLVTHPLANWAALRAIGK